MVKCDECDNIAVVTRKGQKLCASCWLDKEKISILNRHADQFTHMGKKKPKRVDFSTVVEQLESARQNMRNKDEYRVRKCLSCRKEKLMHKVMFVCDSCKSGANYKSPVEDYRVAY